MCEVCTEAVHFVALWTRVTLRCGHVWSMYRSSPRCEALSTRVTLRCGHVWSMYRSSPLRSTLNTSYIKVRTCVKYVSKQYCVALWTRVTLRCGLCEVCTEAVHCVALWTRVTLRCGHVWSMYRSSPLRSTLNTSYIKVRTCVKYVPKQSIAEHFEHEVH